MTIDRTIRIHPPPGRGAGEIRTALRDLGPVVVGLMPFGVLIGMTSVRSGVGGEFGLVTAVAWFGGSAQLAAITLLAAGTAPAAVVAAVVVTNARFLLYGAALEPRFRDQPGWFRWLAPHFVTDPTYALAVRRPGLAGGAGFRRYWLTVGAGLATAWLAATALGIAAAPLLPAGSTLGIAAPALFLLALLVPLLAAWPGLVGAVIGAVAAAAASPAAERAGHALWDGSGPARRHRRRQGLGVMLLAATAAGYVLRISLITLFPAGRLPAPLRRALHHLAPGRARGTGRHGAGRGRRAAGAGHADTGSPRPARRGAHRLADPEPGPTRAHRGGGHGGLGPAVVIPADGAHGWARRARRAA